MSVDPVRDHLEKTFGDAYRKEIEQEENVWRSLPFFAAALALQLAAIAQLREWVAAATGYGMLAALVLLGSAGIATLAALFFVLQSIAPARFRYVTPEPELIGYAAAVRKKASAKPGTTPEAADALALAAVRGLLVEQYALAAVHNRTINQLRATRRTRAGIATLVSILLLVGLLALSVVTTSSAHQRVLHGGGERHVLFLG